jgi:GH15 family glucan-1,4-alpha-glucosidase
MSRADELVGWVKSCATPDGELAEQIPSHLNYPDMLRVWEEKWGKIALPLLWSHASYITLAKHMEMRNEK